MQLPGLIGVGKKYFAVLKRFLPANIPYPPSKQRLFHSRRERFKGICTQKQNSCVPDKLFTEKLYFYLNFLTTSR